MTKNNNSKWDSKLIGSKYRETLEEVASKCVEQVIFGTTELEIVPYIKLIGKCYYDKCPSSNLSSQNMTNNIQITYKNKEKDTIERYSFHKNCFSKMIIERVDKQDYKID
tara:strand:+ start:201 stop:530 length:330 start_codon:yes stop_codon:yes gene_type:complete